MEAASLIQSLNKCLIETVLPYQVLNPEYYGARFFFFMHNYDIFIL